MKSLSRRLGEHVRKLRRERSLTQEVLAERSELSVDAIRRIERGAFSPSLNTLEKLTRGLEISLRTLFATLEQDASEDSTLAAICDYLARRSKKDLRTTWRVIRALFEKEELST